MIDGIPTPACVNVTAAWVCDCEAMVPVEDATVPVEDATVPDAPVNDGIVTDDPVMIVLAVPAELIESVRLACPTADEA